MKIIETTFEKLPTKCLLIGFEGENLRATVRIDCSSVFAEYPNATPALIVKPLFADAYPVVVDRNGTCVDWLITSEILSFNGDGEIQLIFYKDQVICKSAVSKIRVSRSLTVTGDMPDPVVQWIENANRKLAEVDAQIVELEGMVDTATDAAERAEQSASTASTKAEQAAGSAATASTKAAEVQASANTATAKASEAALSATQARNSAMSAANSESGATAKAAEAAQSAQTAAQKAEQITEAAQIATGKAGEASASATAAQTSATDAASSATAASASETAAKASETAASASATQAAQSVLDAGANAQTAMQKAAEATQSASNAAASATNAATSAETASTKAGEAAQSAQAVAETAEQLADSLEQISQNTADIAEHEQEYNALKAVTLIHNTASGAIASFPDGAEMPVDEVTAQINPVQDLHGYENPWPGGGGKNLLNIDENVMVASGYNRFFPISLAVGDYVISRSGIFGNGYGSQVVLTDDTMGVTILQVIAPSYAFGRTGSSESYAFTITEEVAASAKYLELQVNGNGISFADIESCKLMVEAGTTKTAYAPYSNICPISGFEGLTVTRTGKNLFQKPYHEDRNLIAGVSVVTNDDGSITLDGTATSTFYYNFGTGGSNEKTFKAGTYTLSGGDASASKFRIVAVKNGTYFTATGNKSVTFTIAKESKIYFYGTALTGAVFSNETYYPQFELGSTATDYEPYQGETYEVEFPTEAGTVYGGTDELVSGALISKMGAADMGDLTWTYSTSSGHERFISNVLSPSAKPAPGGTLANAICSMYKTATSNQVYAHSANCIFCIDGDGKVQVYDSGYTDATAFKTAVTGQKVVYELAIPITYSLTAPEITTLLGENNFWHDANGEITVGYKANTKLYIDGKIAELVARIVNS